jgi:hypothetical protein
VLSLYIQHILLSKYKFCVHTTKFRTCTFFVSHFKGQVNSTVVAFDLRNLTVEVKSNINYTFAVSMTKIAYDIIIRTDEIGIKKTKKIMMIKFVLIKIIILLYNKLDFIKIYYQYKFALVCLHFKCNL